MSLPSATCRGSGSSPADEDHRLRNISEGKRENQGDRREGSVGNAGEIPKDPSLLSATIGQLPFAPTTNRTHFNN